MQQEFTAILEQEILFVIAVVVKEKLRLLTERFYIKKKLSEKLLKKVI